MKDALGKTLYGLLFSALLPALLAAWAHALAPAVRLRAPAAGLAGAVVAAAGIGLVLAGWAALWRHGRGLPMNAFPPERLVERGVYGYLSHPIYVGFVVACAGLSVAAGSAAGLFVVTPVAAAGCVALVYGYERASLAGRFGRLPAPRIRLAGFDEAPPDPWERLSGLLLVLIPWALLYEAVTFLGLPPDGVPSYLPFERHWPVWAWTEPVYASAYPLALLAPFVAARRRDLRDFELRGLLAMALVFPLYFAIPLVAPERPFVPHGALGQLLVLERRWSAHGAGAFPSFHVIWALLSLEVVASRAGSGLGRALARGWALCIAASCLTTGMHSLADVVSGIAVAAAVARAAALWERLRAGSERIANSWREWRLGPLRLINHGAYAALGAGGAIWISEALLGPASLPAMLLAGAAGLVGAGLWAQWVEGSPELMRPFGYYGGVLGLVLGAALAGRFSPAGGWLLLGSFAVGGPWVQSLGRLRCLVQGCCHGGPAPEAAGIRYRHPRSRVTRLTELALVPLHPTQLYAILWNAPVALVVGRLWSLHLSVAFPCGAYLLMNGLGRFVEESLRGEPQTPRRLGLRLYQWMALASALAGALVLALPGLPPTPPASFPPPEAALAAVGFGLVVWFALGVDFPQSSRPLSRLA